MVQITLFAVFNVVGLAITAWGVTMLLGTHSPFGPVADITVTSGGLGLVMVSTVLLIASFLSGVSWNNRSSKAPVQDDTVLPPHVPHRDQLVTAMEDVYYSALQLIERRREIHHLNTHQWHYAHRDETAREIAAAKRYRQAKSALELQRLSLPTQFWMPVDSFCDAVETSISREVYSAPNDKQVHETFNHLWHSTMRQINDVAFQTQAPEMEEARQLAD